MRKFTHLKFVGESVNANCSRWFDSHMRFIQISKCPAEIFTYTRTILVIGPIWYIFTNLRVCKIERNREINK